MTTRKQLLANRSNALRSSGPKSVAGKRRSRRNALKHGLAAETVISVIENEDDYRRFQNTLYREYSPQTFTEGELVARLASLFWRLRRATAIETELFQIQARLIEDRTRQVETMRAQEAATSETLVRLFVPSSVVSRHEDASPTEKRDKGGSNGAIVPIAHCFLRLASMDPNILDRLPRYEAAIWRQLRQLILILGKGGAEPGTRHVEFSVARPELNR